MCYADIPDGDYVPLRTSWHTARKPRPCIECGREIQPGERYHRNAYLFDGKPYADTSCRHCDVAHRWLLIQCHGYLAGVCDEDITEHMDLTRGAHALALGRLVVGMRRRWQRHSGGLLPVPRMPDLLPAPEQPPPSQRGSATTDG